MKHFKLVINMYIKISLNSKLIIYIKKNVSYIILIIITTLPDKSIIIKKQILLVILILIKIILQKHILSPYNVIIYKKVLLNLSTINLLLKYCKYL